MSLESVLVCRPFSDKGSVFRSWDGELLAAMTDSAFPLGTDDEAVIATILDGDSAGSVLLSVSRINDERSPDGPGDG